MNERWQQFLASRPAPVAFPQCALADLSHLGLIRVSGADAQQFLQGQFSNDIRQVTAEQAQLNGWCTPKGRMLASLLVMQWREDYLLQLPLDTQPILLKKLPMYVLRSKVKIADAGDDLVRFGIAGPCAETLVAGQFGKSPAQDWSAVVIEQGYCVRLPSHSAEHPRFQVVAEPEFAIACWLAAEAQARPAGADHWAWLDLRAGIPSVQAAISEEFVPQMANLDLINGVSFTKGCYTGQEVVARMKYLGKLKRRMRLAHVASDHRPAPGDELFAAGGTTSGQGAGKVVDARPAPNSGYDLLAVVENASFEAGDLRIGNAEGPRLEFLALPYSLEGQ